jgi:hypothetical protein
VIDADGKQQPIDEGGYQGPPSGRPASFGTNSYADRLHTASDGLRQRAVETFGARPKNRARGPGFLAISSGYRRRIRQASSVEEPGEGGLIVGAERSEVGPDDIEQPVLLDAVVLVAQAVSEATGPTGSTLRPEVRGG